MADMAKEDYRTGVEWDDTPSDELDPLVCSDIRYERDGAASYGGVRFDGTGSTAGEGWGRLRPASEMPTWAERAKR